MNSRNILSIVLLFLILGAIQILLLKNLALFGVAFCFIYLLAILILPISIRPVPLLLLSFSFGLIVDVFYDTLGLHTAAITVLAFLRPHWLKVIKPGGGYDDTENPTLKELSAGWFLSYAFPLIFVFCLVFFMADQWGTVNWLNILNKSFFSSIFTLVLAIIVQLLFFKRRRVI